MSKIIGALSINQGSSSLKSISGDYLSSNDRCIVISDTYGVLFYKLVDNDGSSERLPNIVKPSDTTNKSWYLQSIKHITDDVEVDKDKVLSLNEMSTLSDNEITIRDISGNVLFYISESEIKSYVQFTANDLQTTKINNIDTNNIILKDGSRSFTDSVAGVDPVDDEDLTTKIYVDMWTESLSASFDSKFNDIENNYARWDNTIQQTPSHDYNPATKAYVDESNLSLESTLSEYYVRWDNEEEQTPINEYNPVTKKYVDKTKWVEWSYHDGDIVGYPNKGYIIDASNNSITLSLPTSAAELGDTVIASVIDISNTVKIDREGGKILGQEEDLYIDVSDSGLTLTFTGDNYGWAIVSEISGVSPLDGDTIEISWDPSYYIPDSSIIESSSVNDLSAHLKGIDDKFLAPEELKTTSEPSDPVAGRSIMYLSDGSAVDENAGDLMMKVNIGGTVKKKTISAF